MKPKCLYGFLYRTDKNTVEQQFWDRGLGFPPWLSDNAQIFVTQFFVTNCFATTQTVLTSSSSMRFFITHLKTGIKVDI